MKIKLLSPEVIGCIAAGEVVENCFSVVKELVENSIDAKAKRVVVEIENGGMDSIVVCDDGEGMDAEDLKMSVKHHATSKIASPEDLLSIKTLGFRGEALASIATVSKLTITSRPPGAPSAMQLQVNAGKIERFGEVAAGPGTKVEVRDLFYNIPARRKSLGDSNTQRAKIKHLLIQYTLAYPHIYFELKHNNHRLLQLFPQEDLYSRLRALLPPSIGNELIALDYKTYKLHLYGYITRPHCGRSSGDMQWYFVNGRAVRSFVLRDAVQRSYSTLTSNKFPPVFLFLDIDPCIVDVNVHPAKLYVRFFDENLVWRVVYDGIQNALKIPNLSLPQKPSTPQKYEDEIKTAIATYLERKQRDLRLQVHATPPTLKQPQQQQIKLQIKTHRLNILGQLQNTYIVVTDGTDLYLIDQHAAHERILYEKLSRQKICNKVQPLLVPISVSLSELAKVQLEKYRDIFEQLGFKIEEFGHNTILICSIPAELSDKISQEFILGVLADVASLDNLSDPWHQMLAALSCHAAVKANEALSIQQMHTLIDMYEQTETFQVCPHGRPTIIKVSYEEIKRRFRR